MNRKFPVVAMVFLSLYLFCAGCDLVTEGLLHDGNKCSVYARYAPVKVDIMPLTGFVSVGEQQHASKVRVYVSLQDAVGSQVKGPAVFRFELYEHIARSAQNKGKRVLIWPDIDLSESSENNEHWRDFLRAYEFILDFEPQSNRTYILQVTSLCPNCKRLTAEFELRPAG